MIDPSEIAAAAQRLHPYIRRTPVLTLTPDDTGLAYPITLKLEFLQHSGSFKARGAFNRLLLAGDAARAGVVAASGGNHGAAVAYAARRLGLPSTIFVPGPTPAAKLARIAAYGAAIVQGGADYRDAYEASYAWARARGALEVHAYDDADVLAGQGTVGLEMLADAPDLSHLFVAVGGGGLIGGIASAMAGHPVQVVGVEPEGCAALHAALAAGRPVPGPVGGVAADSLGARQIGCLGLAAAQQGGVQSVLVTDQSIVAAQAFLWDRLRIVAEPGGAAALAPLLDGRWVALPGSRVGVVLCGANMDPARVA